jgi:hypothetical protein
MFNLNRLTTEEKALKINLDQTIYGCFAEIGAGQEVATNFFKAGGSSGTIAYTRSAYDMSVSDHLYGQCKRYVAEDRLDTMLSYEFDRLNDILPNKAKDTRFFAYANTVESLNFHKTNQGHGWIGLRFQLNPDTPPNDIILHIKLHDTSHKMQQQALGILGINLIYATYFGMHELNTFLDTLTERLPRERIEIDMLRVTGPDYEAVDNRIIALNLVKKGITDSTMFTPNGDVVQASASLYKKNLLLLRGRFRPITKVHVDMFNTSMEQFIAEPDVEQDNIVALFELTLKDLTSEGQISDADFIDRAKLLGSLGYTVMISNYLKHYKMVEYLSSINRGSKIGVTLGIMNLHDIFNDDYYNNLKGGILEAFGKGFSRDVKLFVYPALKDGEFYCFEDFSIPKKLEGLLQYMKDNDKIVAINNINKEVLSISSDNVLKMIKEGNCDWKLNVPKEVANAISELSLFDVQENKGNLQSV